MRAANRSYSRRRNDGHGYDPDHHCSLCDEPLSQLPPPQMTLTTITLTKESCTA